MGNRHRPVLRASVLTVFRLAMAVRIGVVGAGAQLCEKN
jgi:hypothetical protein